ncbi:MAG TPA: hypothetical protein VMZ28_17125 [Kofleriaceae bacterium]|nr:hypothetical protein [Kofleriaceae bacterium]
MNFRRASAALECAVRVTRSVPCGDEHRSILSAGPAPSAVGPTAIAARDAIAQEDFAALARQVGPGKGVCLAASKGGSCRWVTANELAECGKSKEAVEWDVDSGSDEPTRLTCREAFRTIFFGHAGLAKAAPTYDTSVDRFDNNAASIIHPDAPGAVHVEFHAPDPTYPDGNGWRSLWLAYDRRGDTYRLVAVTSHYWGI